jgi:hypothetical protein
LSFEALAPIDNSLYLQLWTPNAELSSGLARNEPAAPCGPGPMVAITRAVQAGGRLVIAIDGKTVRGAKDENGKAPHLVAALAHGNSRRHEGDFGNAKHLDSHPHDDTV